MSDLANWRPDFDDRPCPDCGAPTLVGDWWDDPPELGGGLIGTLHKCTQCEWSDRR